MGRLGLILSGGVARLLACSTLVVVAILSAAAGASAVPAYDLAAWSRAAVSSGERLPEVATVLTTTSTSPGSFSDVPEGSQFTTEIQWLREQGISTGWAMPDGTSQYRPLLPVARDAMAAFLYRLAGSPAFTPPAVSPFTDVPTGSQFYSEITWLAAQGISTGWAMPDGSTQYRPLQPVGRDAMAAFMYRLDASPAFDAPMVSPFADINPTALFYKEITWLSANGISTGWPEADGSHTYRPLNSVARDAMAAFMYRYYQVIHPSAAGDGNDVSWPQCDSALPRGQAFGIVGVNNGTADSTNPCLAAELSWAASSLGGTSQSKAALYVNTANPGTEGSWWPTGNTYAGKTVANPYGHCSPGSVGAACSYMYGYAKAYEDASSRGVSAPGSYTWWLDVETGNTWSTDTAANLADLEGMAAYFSSIGAQVGIYSTGAQWASIVGAVPSTSTLYALRSWIAGATTAAAAAANCSAAPLTGGGKVALTQYTSGAYDFDHSCS